jgi:hypothetical protein
MNASDDERYRANIHAPLVGGGVNMRSNVLVREDTKPGEPQQAMLQFQVYPLPQDEELLAKLAAAMRDTARAVLLEAKLITEHIAHLDPKNLQLASPDASNDDNAG